MKIPKEEAGLWNWATGSRPSVNANNNSNNSSNNNSKTTSEREQREHRYETEDDRRQRQQSESRRCERRGSELPMGPRPSKTVRGQKSSSRRGEDREEEHQGGGGGGGGGGGHGRQSAEREQGSHRDSHHSNGGKVEKRSSRMRYNPGPITRNPFLNFMRTYRQQSEADTVQEVMRAGARIWRRLSDKDKEEFVTQARRAPAPVRRRRKRGSYKRF